MPYSGKFTPKNPSKYRGDPTNIIYRSSWERRVMNYLDNEKQTKAPTQKRKTKTFISESITYAINQEKWRAADLFCREHGWQFMLVTEKDLGI